VEAAEKAIMKLVGGFEKERQQRNKLYEQGQGKVNKLAEERDKLFKEAEAAYASGNKEKAAQVIEELLALYRLV